ncbi:unnamed protein product, partial [Brugia timori]|uniref:UDENN domain-containing protein n=1 Tax=Brugia timori TaxID=42155 RepID=A0A0R3RA73_9BILA
NPLGATIVDSNDSFYFPLGYRHQFDDPLTGIVILGPEARPYDTFVGRFMSISISYVTSPVDIFAPEYESDPFRAIPTESNLLRHFPVDLEKWMEMCGFSLSQALPSTPNPIQNDGLKKLLQLPDSLCTITATHVLSSSFCSLIHKVKHFKQFLTATPPVLLPFSHPPLFVLFDKPSYSSSDSLGFRGLTFIKRPSDKVISISDLDYLDCQLLTSVVSLYGDRSSNRFVKRLRESAVDVIERFLKILFADLFLVKPSGSIFCWYFRLNGVFEVIGHSLKEDEKLNALRILLVGSSFLNIMNMHLSGELVQEAVRSELIREQTLEIGKIIWNDEVERARYGTITRHSWTESELSQLHSKGL